ncbi:MAG: CPBP family intramembrane glutamic endopeptidase [Bacteroidota bacterium]
MMIVLTTLKTLFASKQDSQIHFLVLILLITGFIIYYFASKTLNVYFKKLPENKVPSFYSMTYQRILGFSIFGVIPAVIVLMVRSKSLTNYGLNFNQLQTSFIWTLILGLGILLANYYLAGKPQNLKNYPQIRFSNWTLQKLLINCTTWTLYLFGYELMFRGLLLFSFYYAYGTGIAIVVNTILYSLVHIPKGKKETFGAIPLGIVLCFVTLNTGSVFFAFIFHVIMALSNDYFAIKAHPSMTINLNKI